MANGQVVAGVVYLTPMTLDPEVVEQMVTTVGKVTLKLLLVKHQSLVIPLNY